MAIRIVGGGEGENECHAEQQGQPAEEKKLHITLRVGIIVSSQIFRAGQLIK
jgi:hypothetical protein